MTHRKARENEAFQLLHIYRFTGKENGKYIVHVEEYEDEVFVVKFYMKRHKRSPDKYRLLSHMRDMQGIVRTCIEIMLEVYRKRPFASFGFLGMPNSDEARGNTQRYRIYKYVMQNFFPPTVFRHYPLDTHSAYLMLNVNSLASLDAISERFAEWYPGLMEPED